MFLKKVSTFKGTRKHAAEQILGADLHPSYARWGHHAKVLMYAELAHDVFSKCSSLSIAADPSTHNGQDTNIIVAYSWQNPMLAYLPPQIIKPIQQHDLTDHLQALAQLQALPRKAAFCNTRSLEHALQSVGWSFSDLKLPEHWVVRPLTALEVKFCHGGVWYVMDTVSKLVNEMYPDAPLPKQLVVTQDQGSIGVSGLNYLSHNQNLCVTWVPDWFHRFANDLKGSLQDCQGYFYKTMLELTVVFNLSYGPFKSSTFHEDRQNWLVDLISSNSWQDEQLFLEFVPLICKERNIPEATTPEQLQALWDSLAETPTVLGKGPFVKLSRWGAWWDSAYHHVRLSAVNMLNGFISMTHQLLTT